MKTFWSPITAVLVLCSLLSGQSITVKQSSSAYVFPNGVSVPSDYPHIKISVKNNPDPGFIFINNWNGTPYMAILDTSGAPVFFRKMPGYVRDFKLQANGNLSYRVAAPFYSFFEMDSSYSVLREIKAKNGYGTDEHELQILPNGNVLLIALEWKTVDMSKLVPGGRTNATVVGNHVQEINPAGNVVFEWKCWDHLNIVDAVKENLTAQTIDYVHMNAIAVDIDSNLLLSNRHLSEITKINRKTGAIMWRLGGKNNQFTFIGDPLNGPSYQHDIRALPNGNITFMDNGNFHSPSLSRAVEYTLDTAARTATLAWHYRHSPDRYTWWMGNVQRLPNGNTLINWADGSLPKLTEVTPAGVKALELDFVKTAHSYRVFKFPWKGKAKAPELTLEAGVDKVTLIYNTFDQRPSHTYLLYIDTVPNPLRLVDSTAFSAADITGFKNGKRYYFRVTSRDSAGKESPFSNETDLLVNFVAPGENIVANGDFSGGLQEWKFNVTSPAAAVPYITAQGEAFVQIGSGGSEIWHIQMTQGNIPQVNGRKYRFEFDAYASGSRTIDARIEKAVSPYTNYSKTSIVALTAAKKHYAYDFTMQDPTDNSANIVFNCGLSDIDLFIDNVSLKQIVPQSADDVRNMHPAGYVLAQNFPNPFNPSTTIQYGIPAESDVRIRIVDILGRLVDEIVNERQPAGWQSVTWNAAVPSGIYFCRMEIAAVNSTEWRTAAARKLIVVK